MRASASPPAPAPAPPFQGKVFFLDPALPETQRVKLREKIVAFGGGVAARYGTDRGITHVVCIPSSAPPTTATSPLSPRAKTLSRTKQLSTLMMQPAPARSVREQAAKDLFVGPSLSFFSPLFFSIRTISLTRPLCFHSLANSLGRDCIREVPAEPAVSCPSRTPLALSNPSDPHCRRCPRKTFQEAKNRTPSASALFGTPR